MPDNKHFRMRVGVIRRISLLLSIATVFSAIQIAHATDYRPRTQYQKADDTRNVLVLNSSHRGYGWTDSIMEGVESRRAGGTREY